MTEPKICDPGGGAVFVPLFGGSSEGTWNKELRAVLYGIVMCYFFLGSSIISDYFMSAIEAITGKKMRIVKNGRVATVFLWNDTVANLTLLALGSSAPEILLSIVEIVKGSFFAGELGPSTIVGSAAFNTQVIVAVSVLAIPSPGLRYIKGAMVYSVTVVFSMMAYIWLLLIVVVFSPDVIEIWEGLMTLFFFFLLVTIAYVTDKREDELFAQQRARDYASRFEAPPPAQSLGSPLEDEFDLMGKIEVRGHMKPRFRKLLNPHLRMIRFHKDVIKDKANARLTTKAIDRLTAIRGSLDGPRSGKAGERGGFTESVLALLDQSPPAGDDGKRIHNTDGVTITNPSGVITFLVDCIEVKGSPTDVCLSVPVLRRNGCEGMVSCKYRTERLGAIPGYDYQEARGEVVFPPGVVMQEIQLVVLPQRSTENSESFQLVLEDEEGGATFNPNDDGEDTMAILTITICNNLGDEPVSIGARCFETLVDPELLQYGLELWREQVVNALSATDSDDAPTMGEQAIHVVSLPWKLTFAILAPPPVYCGGWLLFLVALFVIGTLTAIISDLASNFGCCLGIEDAVTAIIVVSPGTSLPDLFASQAAAFADEHADASIVNVTGSNSVNVFLGIGLSWSVAAFYWAAAESTTNDWNVKNPEFVGKCPNDADACFVVRKGTLAYSVVLFTCIEVVTLAVLRIKRILLGGELGGTTLMKHGVAALLVALWMWYLFWNILKSSTDAADVGQFISMGIALVFIVACLIIDVGAATGRIHAAELGGDVQEPPPSAVWGSARDKLGLLEAHPDIRLDLEPPAEDTDDRDGIDSAGLPSPATLSEDKQSSTSVGPAPKKYKKKGTRTKGDTKTFSSDSSAGQGPRKSPKP